MSVESARNEQLDGNPSGPPLTADQISKVHKELEVVRSNMTVLSEILVEIKPEGNHPEDLQLLQDLYKTCKEMQGRVTQLLCTPLTDELTVHMLQINDDLNDLFDRYDRKVGGVTTQNKESNRGAGGGEMSLIDWGDEGTTPSLISDIRAMNLNSAAAAKPSSNPAPVEDKDFESFVQSRNNPPQASGEAKKSNEEEIIQAHRETDFEEMENWLKANPGASDASLMSGNPQFEAYLAERSTSDSNKTKDPSSS